MNELPPVSSINDLQAKAKENPLYKQLAIRANQNLGGFGATYEQALQHLSIQATETGDESAVVDEINFCIGLLR